MRANGFSEASIAAASAAAPAHFESIRTAIGAGVSLLCGTDLPPGDDVGGLPATVYEMRQLELAGLSRLGALQAATVNPARLMGVATEIGQARAGFRADLIVVENNPLDDLAALGRVRAVLQEGRLVSVAG
jgi:imidazolonepropionase-like amidohydrolase